MEKYQNESLPKVNLKLYNDFRQINKLLENDFVADFAIQYDVN